MEFARGARIIQNSTGPSLSAYGDNWDMLWVGHCGSHTRVSEKRFFIIRDDLTARPAQYSQDFFAPHIIASHEDMQNATRLVYQAGAGMCTYGYAVSYNGARKILAALSITSVNQAVDNAYSFMCGGGTSPDFLCIAPYPSLIGSWRPSGPGSRDSDIRMEGDETWHHAWSRGIVYSTMLNIQHLVAGRKIIWPQWDDASLPALDLSEMRSREGYLLHVDGDTANH